jgi:hypothetical protein
MTLAADSKGLQIRLPLVLRRKAPTAGFQQRLLGVRQTLPHQVLHCSSIDDDETPSSLSDTWS